MVLPMENVKSPSLATYDKVFDEVVLVLYKEYRKKKKAEKLNQLDS